MISALVGLAIILGVFAQPILGWSAIPEFFGHSLLAALLLGGVDGLLLAVAVFLIVEGAMP